MVFREAAERPRPSGRVLHGPFPTKFAALGAFAAFAFLAVVCAFVALETERLRCPTTGVCTIDGRPSFRREDIKNVRVVIETGSKNAKYGVVTFDLASSATPSRMMRVEPSGAEDAAAAIRSALARGEPVDVDVHGPRWMAILAIACGIAGAVAIHRALSKMGRFDLVITSDGQALHVRRSLLAIPLGSRIVHLDGVTGVVIERSSYSPFMASRYEPPIPAARLTLTCKGGEERPLTASYFPGEALHYRAAMALRAALTLPPDDADDAALAAIPMRTTPMSMRIMYAWIGVTTGSLIGMALLGLTLALFNRAMLRANIEGWMFAAGMVPGAVAGAAIAFHATRQRLPR
jgi:hypothetical protein